MSFEDQIAELNEHFFFREFTYSKNTFRPTPADEVELADNIIWLNDLVIAFQLKERKKTNATSADEERKWFERKVLSVGTKQIRDTLTYLHSHPFIELENHRGHRFRLVGSQINTIHKVICYLPNNSLPVVCSTKKFHRSKTAGIIHLIQAKDYLGIARTLLTPPELSEYLSFREELIERWNTSVDAVPEPALVGQYICGDADTRPSLGFLENLAALDHRADDWDISGIIKNFPDRITTDNRPTDYYSIVSEIAELKRNELREFKKRFQLSMDKCRNDVFAQPYRFASLRTDCGFVFVPLMKEFLHHRQQGLQNYTFACKYDLKLSKCIGVSFAPEDDGWYSVEWCYVEFPWEYDEEIERRLQEDNPFREVRTSELKRYSYRE